MDKMKELLKKHSHGGYAGRVMVDGKQGEKQEDGALNEVLQHVCCVYCIQIMYCRLYMSAYILCGFEPLRFTYNACTVQCVHVSHIYTQYTVTHECMSVCLFVCMCVSKLTYFSISNNSVEEHSHNFYFLIASPYLYIHLMNTDHS